MNSIIRHEKADEYFCTELVAREAFRNLYLPGAYEHAVVHAIRKHRDFIPELSYIIEIDNKIQGGIFYTHSAIVCKNERIPTVSFGPVFIAPALQRKGYGRKLISYSIQKAKEYGARAILTLGYPYHYSPYGFVGAKKYGISMPDNKYYQGLLAFPLYEGALDNIQGYVEFSPVSDVTEEEMEKFDSQFPYKEKAYQKSQDEYAKACEMLDETIY